MASFLITGCSRGFGIALTRELVSRPASQVGVVFATARGHSTVLEELAKTSHGRVITVKLDVTNEASIKQAAAEVGAKLQGKGLDVLINNAGVCQYAPDGVKSMDNLQETFAINVLGVHWVTRAFLPLLQKGNLKKVANISTTLGSTTLAGPAHYLPAPAYKISKAAMNALTVQYALDYEKEGFTFIAVCPGWMKTDLGGGDMADLTPEQGAKASLDIILQPGQGKCPRCWSRAGRMPKATTSTTERLFHGSRPSLLSEADFSRFGGNSLHKRLVRDVTTVELATAIKAASYGGRQGECSKFAMITDYYTLLPRLSAYHAIAKMRGVKVFSGRSHPALTKAICERLGTTPGRCELGAFSNGEISVQIGTSVRNEDIFIVQSGSPKINDSIMELLIMISACKGGSAKSITAVVPYFPYSRQSKKKAHRGPITAKMLANLMSIAGVTHIITVDLHSSLMQGFFGKPVDNLEAQPLLARWVKTNVRNWKEAVVVSKNVGGTKRVTAFADLLKLRFAIISTDRDRSRQPQYVSSSMNDSTVFFDAIAPHSIRTQQRESDHDEGDDADNESEPRPGKATHSTPTKRQVNGASSRLKSVTISSEPTAYAAAAEPVEISSPYSQGRGENVPSARRPSEYEANDGAFDERARDVVIGRLIHGHVVDDDHPSPALSNVSVFGQGLPSTSLLPEAIDDSDHNPMTLSFMSNASSLRPDHALGGTVDAAATSDEEEEVMKNPEVEHTVTLVGDVKNRTVLIVDDIMDRAASWVAAAETCVKRGMARKVYCMAIHALLSDESLDELEACDCIDHIIVTNTFPVSAEKIKSSRKLVVIELSNLLSEAIRRNHHGESVQAFDQLAD